MKQHKTGVQIESLEFIVDFIEAHYAQKQIKSIKPFCFTIGSNNRSEGLSLETSTDKALYYGYLYLCINPNDNPLSPEKIEIRYQSYMNHSPFYKYITRYVEKENLINENSSSLELFDSLEVTQQSTKYDFYLTFVGFKIDLI